MKKIVLFDRRCYLEVVVQIVYHDNTIETLASIVSPLGPTMPGKLVGER